jgi:hypothetical protein
MTGVCFCWFVVYPFILCVAALDVFVEAEACRCYAQSLNTIIFTKHIYTMYILF